MENINFNVLNYIVKDINLSVARLGINTQLSIVEKQDYKNEPYLAIDSTPFQTMPMIFKSIKVDGNIYVLEDKNNEDIVKVAVRLDYRYKTFDDGSNGHQLGMVRYEVDKEYWGKWDGKNENWTRNNIIKTQGLSI